MFAYAVRRILQFFPTIFFISILMFLMLNVLPGDAVLMSGNMRRNVDEATAAALRKKMGLDQPLYVRYWTYVKDLAHGDLGKSFLRQEKVNNVVAERLWPTLKLAVVAMIIAVVIGIPLGFISALRQGTWLDTTSMVGAVSGISLPQFWLGLMLMYMLGVWLRWLPPQGYGDGDFIHIIMPAFTLGVGYMALLARTTRAAVVEVLTQDYIRTARAKGLSEMAVNKKHVLRNTLILVLTTAGLQFGALMGQTVIVEKLFSWPGIGSLLVDSIFQRDIPVTQGCVLIIITIFLVVNLVVDLMYAFIDPRIEYK